MKSVRLLSNSKINSNKMQKVITWIIIIFIFLAGCVLYVNVQTTDGPIDWGHQIGIAVETTVNFVVSSFNKIF